MIVESEARRPILEDDWSLEAFLKRSPVDTCSALKAFANHFDIVPFPDAFKIDSKNKNNNFKLLNAYLN